MSATPSCVVPAETSSSDGAALQRIAQLDEVLATIDEIRAAASRDRSFAATEPWPVFVRTMRLLGPQSYGTRMQNYLADFFGWDSVSQQLDRGDVVDSQGDYYEVKVTFITTSNKAANFVQVRPHQDLAGYHLFVVDTEYALHHFCLTKQEMAAELDRAGSSAHGTVAAVTANARREYALRFEWSADDPTCRRWQASYLVPAPLPS